MCVAIAIVSASACGSRAEPPSTPLRDAGTADTGFPDDAARELTDAFGEPSDAASAVLDGARQVQGRGCANDDDCGRERSCLTLSAAVSESGYAYHSVRFPGGQCTLECGAVGFMCPQGSACIVVQDRPASTGGGGFEVGLFYCLDVCVDDADCRTIDGFTCRASEAGAMFGDATRACLPDDAW
jgi:hypothetical protein